LTTATNADPDVVLTIMDGGGNDILICDGIKFPNCGSLCNRPGSTLQKVCTDIVATAIDAGSRLLDSAAAAGVKDAVYFFYPHVPSNGGGYREILDYAETRAKAFCDGAATRTGGRLTCHFVSLVQAFANAGGDMNLANFAADGIHPSQAGQDIIARQIQSAMVASCLGSTGGCCAP